MVLVQFDNNSYIHRPGYEMKEAGEKNKLAPVTTLSNNEEYRTLVPFGSPIINQPRQYYKLIDYVKSTPELISPIEALVTDTISGFDFEPLGDTDSPQKIKRAHEFCIRNHLLQQLRNAERDSRIYGNGYLAINRIQDEEIKSLLSTNGYEYKSDDYEFKEYRAIIDELAYSNTTIKYVPSTTVSIFVEDKFGEVVKYKQVVGTESMTFDETDVLHFKDVEYDGKLFGYSRIYSLISEIQMLWNAKNYIGRYFDNNGTPNLLFIAPKMQPASPQYKEFVAQLQDLKKAENKQRNLLSTSEIKVERLNEMNTGLQFKELLDYCTGLLAMTYQVPPTRIGVAGSANGEAVTLTNQGYYRNVSSRQDYLEEILNSQLFIPVLGVKGKLRKDYKEDEQREVTIYKTKTDTIEQLLRLNLITREAAAKMAREYMNFLESDTPTDEEVAKQKEEELKSNMYMQGQKSETDLKDAPQEHERKNKTPNKYK